VGLRAFAALGAAAGDAIVATSQAYADSSQPLRPWLQKVEVVPIGISDNRMGSSREKAASIRNLVAGRRIVFALGRMTYYKGFDVLIEAARSLPEDCAVLIGGDGELFDHYRTTLDQQGLADKVKLLGHVVDGELASHFEACDVFCMPSTLRAEASWRGHGRGHGHGQAGGDQRHCGVRRAMGQPARAHGAERAGARQWGSCGCTQPPLRERREDVPLLAAHFLERYTREFSAKRMTQRTLELYRRLLPAAAA
jgi:rhamnosyl/mannosyltransferase